MASSEINKSENSRHVKQLKIVLVHVFVVLIVLLSIFTWYAYKRRKLNRAGIVKVNERQDLDLPLFDLLQIANATDNFSFTNKLGEGGFGSVYKIYIMSFDRAGYGENDPYPKRSVKSEAYDIQQLADKLQIDPKFYVIGISMGGYPVWSCLKYIPHRSFVPVRSFASVCSMPLDNNLMVLDCK